MKEIYDVRDMTRTLDKDDVFYFGEYEMGNLLQQIVRFHQVGHNGNKPTAIVIPNITSFNGVPVQYDTDSEESVIDIEPKPFATPLSEEKKAEEIEETRTQFEEDLKDEVEVSNNLEQIERAKKALGIDEDSVDEKPNTGTKKKKG